MGLHGVAWQGVWQCVAWQGVWHATPYYASTVAQQQATYLERTKLQPTHLWLRNGLKHWTSYALTITYCTASLAHRTDDADPVSVSKPPAHRKTHDLLGEDVELWEQDGETLHARVYIAM